MFAIFGMGPQEIALLAVIGVLLFGRKLPETARHIGKALTEFKNGLRGVEDHLEGAIASPAQPINVPQRATPTAAKFQGDA